VGYLCLAGAWSVPPFLKTISRHVEQELQLRPAPVPGLAQMMDFADFQTAFHLSEEQYARASPSNFDIGAGGRFFGFGFGLMVWQKYDAER